MSETNTGVTKMERNLCSHNDRVDDASLKDMRKEQSKGKCRVLIKM